LSWCRTSDSRTRSNEAASTGSRSASPTIEWTAPQPGTARSAANEMNRKDGSTPVTAAAAASAILREKPPVPQAASRVGGLAGICAASTIAGTQNAKFSSEKRSSKCSRRRRSERKATRSAALTAS
jgi:hypothetical protein